MNTPFVTMSAILALAVLFVFLPLALYTLQRYRRKRVLRCPETGRLAEVDIDAPRAAFFSIFGEPLLRVKNCSLWSKRRRCDEECLK